MTARTSRAPGLGARGAGAPGPAHATRGRILDVEDCLPTRSNRESRIPLGESRSFEDRRRPHPTRPSTAADGHQSDPGRARRTGGLDDQELAQRSESARHDAPEEPDEGHAKGGQCRSRTPGYRKAVSPIPACGGSLNPRLTRSLTSRDSAARLRWWTQAKRASGMGSPRLQQSGAHPWSGERRALYRRAASGSGSA